MMGTPVVTVERRGDVGIVWLERPEVLNAISLQLADALLVALSELVADPACRAVVLAGRGKVFCAGADIKEAREVQGVADAVTFLRRARRLFDGLAELPLPTIAAVHGVALGGGFELAIACDFRFVAEGTQLGLPELKIGALPAGGGMSRITGLVGLAQAKEIVLASSPLDAPRAAALGLATQVVPADEVVDRAVEYAQQFARTSPAVYRLAKAALQRGAGTDAAASSELELLATAAVFGTADRREGMTAFLEKREPIFEGR
jgi:enoyl-CoA hydratase/carnithine racemase